MTRAGVFGKLPTAGDFVARELPRGLRPRLDRWLTATLEDPGSGWPPDGLRALFPWSGGVATLVALPSADRSGRSFPLAALCNTAEAPSHTSAEAWCAAAAPHARRAIDGAASIDELLAALSAISPPEGPPHPLHGPLSWRSDDLNRPSSA